MCGILGIVGQHADTHGINKILHRGPDAIGSVSFPGVQLHMARLSIQDASDIHVPFCYHDIGISLAYNGEIYNCDELRKRLPSSEWETECDAEVIAKMWRRYGPNSLHYLNGMFAFVLYDKWSNEVFAVRDRAGEKPLYYTITNSGIAFASEIKALPIELEETECPEESVFEYDCLSNTPFKNVFALLPGHYIYVDCESRKHKVSQWWDLPTDSLDMKYEDVLEYLDELVRDACRIRMPSESYAVALSGGLDSAIVQSIVRCPTCYVITFPQIQNAPQAEKCTCGAVLHSVTFTKDDFQDALPKVLYYLDTPATWTSICDYFLIRQMHLHGHRILLSGEGADELFGGYNRYRILYWLDKMFADPSLRKYKPTTEFLIGKHADILAKLICRGPNIDHAKEIVKQYAVEGKSLVENACRIEFKTTMQVLLRMPDRMAGMFGMENRAPFLDYRLIELAFQLPESFKVTSEESKHILRDVARRLKIHKSIVDEKDKKGLAIPYSDWFPEFAYGSRGIWDRSKFAEFMKDKWRRIFLVQEQR